MVRNGRGDEVGGGVCVCVDGCCLPLIHHVHSVPLTLAIHTMIKTPLPPCTIYQYGTSPSSKSYE